jgi:hypothetical protein
MRNEEEPTVKMHGYELRIDQVRLAGATRAEVATGLLGWVSCVLQDTLRLDGLALRRTADGRLALSFPARKDARGREHPYVRPLDDRARREIEAQVFRALGIGEVTP